MSDEENQEKLICESLKIENSNYAVNIQNYEKLIEESISENLLLNGDISKLSTEIESLDKEIFSLNQKIKEQEYKNILEYNELQSKIEKENANLQIILCQMENLQNQENHKQVTNYTDYLDKKFSNEKFDENYIIQNINKDIIDFQNFTKEQIQKKHNAVAGVISLLQEIVDQSKFDYRIQIFGSYATGLCLPSSDLDLILVPRSIPHGKEYTILQSLYIKLQEVKCLSAPKLIENFINPFIVIQANELYDYININISIQDMKHTGLQCVELVKHYLNSYKVLEPLNITIKQVLKNANLLYYYVSFIFSNKTI